MKNEAKYIRVSTNDQSTGRQEVDGIQTFIDHCSGSIPLGERPEGKKLLAAIDAGAVGVLHIHSIDRLGRNTINILEVVEDLASKGVNVISQKEGLQTLAPDGTINPTARAVLGVMASMAQFERDLLLERQREGIAVAKERGHYSGNGGARRQPDSPEKVLARHSAVVKELKRGESVRRVAVFCSVSKGTVQKVKRLARELGRL